MYYKRECEQRRSPARRDMDLYKPRNGTAQTRTQPLDFFLSLGAGASTLRMASSNTFLRPFCVSAEHSR